MIDFLQAHFLAAIVLFFLSLVAILISMAKISLHHYGRAITFMMIGFTLLATLLLLEDSHLQKILIKVLTVSCVLFGSVILFKYVKHSLNN